MRRPQSALKSPAAADDAPVAEGDAEEDAREGGEAERGSGEAEQRQHALQPTRLVTAACPSPAVLHAAQHAAAAAAAALTGLRLRHDGGELAAQVHSQLLPACGAKRDGQVGRTLKHA